MAIKLLSKALQANPAVQYTRTIIYTLGQIYHNMKLHDEAKKMYQNAVIRGIFPDSMQRPGIVLKDLLPGYPFPTEATVPGVGKAIDHLEKNFQSISKELALAVEVCGLFGDYCHLTNYGSMRKNTRKFIRWTTKTSPIMAAGSKYVMAWLHCKCNLAM